MQRPHFARAERQQANKRRPGRQNVRPAWPSPAAIILTVVPLFLAALTAAKIAGVVGISTGELIVVAIRMLLPLLILRYWLVGGIVAMVADLLDVVTIEFIGHGGFGNHYEQTDKLLDSYYYVLELVVAAGWTNQWTRRPAIYLFGYRLVGAALFEITNLRVLLFVFPNLFENWWLYCVVVMKWFPSIVPHDRRSLLIPMVLLLIPKMAQEYLLHIMQAEPWDWTKRNVLAPVGIQI